MKSKRIYATRRKDRGKNIIARLGVRTVKDYLFGLTWFLVSFLIFYLTFGEAKPLVLILSFIRLDLTILSYLPAYIGLYISLGWIFYILTGFLFSFRKPEKFKMFNPHAPMVSILIPARDEEKVISNLLSDLSKQTYAAWEAVVVAHNCSDRTYEVAKATADKRVRVLEFRGDYGKPVALNHGIRHTEGEIVVIFDADARIDKRFLENLVPYFQKYDAVQARIVSSNSNSNLLSGLVDLEWLAFTDLVENSLSRFGLFALLGGTGQAVKRFALEETGYWDEKNLVEDYDLTLRLLRKGFRIGFASNVRVYDERPVTWTSFFKQRARWLRGNFQILRKHLARSWTEPRIWHLLVSHFGVFLFYYGLILTFLYLLGGTFYTFYFPFWFWLWLFQVIITFLRIVLERGFKGVLLFPLFLLFMYHWLIALWYIPKIKTWKESKTEHFGDFSY
ncbi:MAG: glycosyltransferase family 2 protein [Candidatus Bathyarchaeota archaeon]|nr:MAG: glycosyltransferase family 2 protein [Candidatus Bathyarchaeota archaeon]